MDKRYQVFVSSTYSDLRDEREKIINELTRIGYIAAGMEQFPATDEEQLEYIQRVIDESDYYVVIVRGRYGSEGEDGISFTEKECDYALKTKKPVLAFLFRNLGSLQLSETDNDPAKMAKLLAFRSKLEAKRIVRYWDDPHELVGAVKDSVNDISRRRPGIGWVRGDQAFDPRILKELQDLKLENAELRQRVEAAERSFFPPDLAQGEDQIEIPYERVDYVFKADKGALGMYEQRLGSGCLAESWEGMFLKLADEIYEESSEDRIHAAVRKMISDSIEDPNRGEIQFHGEKIKEMRHQFEALGLINAVGKNYGGQSAVVWRLTPRGRRYVSMKKAIKRSSSET